MSGSDNRRSYSPLLFSPLGAFTPQQSSSLTGGTTAFPWWADPFATVPGLAPVQHGTIPSIMLAAPAVAQNLVHVQLTEADLLRLVGQKQVAAGTRQAETFAELVNGSAQDAAWFCKISENGRRLAHFMAQCCVESGNFKGNEFRAYFKDGQNLGPGFHMEESFAYTDLAKLRETFSSIRNLPLEDAKKLISTPQTDRYAQIAKTMKLPKDQQPKSYEGKTLQQLQAESDMAEQQLRENLANTIYSSSGNKSLGNGDFASGEGYKYRGRGIIQITGKANYESAGTDLKANFVSNPDLVLEPFWSVRTAVWFWDKKGLNALADAHDPHNALDIGNCDKITKIINSGMKHADRRREKLKTALGIWGSRKPE